MKRIAVNTRFLLRNKLEGIGWFTYEVMKRLCEQHPEVEFHFLFDRQYDESFVFSKNVVPHIIQPPARHPLLWYYWFEYAIPAALKKIRPDVFLSTDGFLSLKTNVPSVLVIHDLAFEHFPDHVSGMVQQYYKRYSPQYARKAKQIVTVSEFSKTDIVKQYQIDPNRITVAYNGANTAYHPLPEEEKAAIRNTYSHGKEYFIYVGSIHPRKNIGNLLLAYDLFRKQSGSDIQLLITGRMAWKYKDIQRIFDEMQFSADVIFTGHKNISELAPLVASAYAMCYVSLFEGFGIPVLEALKCRVPVITSETSSMPEVGGDAALLVNPQSAEEISRAMLRLYSESGLRQSLLDKSSIQAAKFNWDKTAEKVWEVLQSHLSQ